MINFECSRIYVLVLPNGQLYIRKLLVNTNICIILIKSLSVLGTLFHLIDLDLSYSTSWGIWGLETIYSGSLVPCKVKTLVFTRTL